MLFSQRKGYKPISEIIQYEGMNDELRITLWNILDEFYWRREGFLSQHDINSGMARLCQTIWFRHFKQPVDTLSYIDEKQSSEIRYVFLLMSMVSYYAPPKLLLNYFRNNYLKDYITSFRKRIIPIPIY